jgi:DNA-directed RNA polymerase subunit alpha
MPQIQTLELTKDYAKFVLEPLERGYGQTIGNALRRVLLSSIQGAAIAAIKVEKVFHEFAPIPGAKEDTTEFLLNLKDLAIRWEFEGSPPDEATLRIDVKGPGRVTGADVHCPPGITIVNPECYLATISDAKASISAELYVGWSSGYVLPERQERYKGVIGVIPTGSQYTPVRKVNYIVEATRVGQRTDYERLIMEVWTNGAVPPNDAVTQAAIILDKYFQMFFELGAAGVDLDFEGLADDLPELSHIPETSIDDLDFSQRTLNCLRRAGLLNLRQLAAVNEADLTGIRGFGKKSLVEVRERLAENGIELKPSKGGYVNIDLLDDDEF